MTSGSSSRPVIRKAGPKDVDRVVEITVEAFRDYTVYYLLEERYGVKFGGRSWSEWKGGELRDFCESSIDKVYVAELDGVVVGYMTYGLNRERKIGVVGNNAVSPAFQRRGIATSLLNTVLETFRREGMEYAQVTTMETDIPALGLYRKAGFEALYRSITHFMKL